MEYKDTLNLPQTSFPMKANLAQREPEMLKKWDEQKLYPALREARHGKPKFILHDGPPYANGHLHIGHVLQKTLKDIVVKAKSLSGYDAPFVPGWDCHGLPIELNVEKQYGKPGLKLTPEEFVQKCREYAKSQIDIQREEFKRLGVLGDWNDPYLTMDPLYEANAIRALGKIIARGHLQHGFKPVHWCMDCRSALAEAEVEYKDKTSHAIDVRFTVVDEAVFLEKMTHVPNAHGVGAIAVPIWTTTPWTLPANQAVALNTNLEYALVQCAINHHHERLLVAQGLLDQVMARYGITDYKVIAYCKGEALENLKLQHPFYDRLVPIVLGEHVNLEAGTGAVHTAPGHGQEDYVVATRYQLAIENPVNDQGCFKSDVPLFAGLHVLKANDQIIERLKTQGKLLHEEAQQHSYPHCWRHKTPVIFRATPQWFISMDKHNLRTKAMEGIFSVEWLPERGRARIASMVEGRPDWCISRQRLWGIPIPLFIHHDTDALHPDTAKLIEEVAKRVEKGGIEAWLKLKSEELLGSESKDYRKVTDTLDVWFDSGVSHACVLKQRRELAFPADLYLEGSDQHRGWFQSSLLSSIAICDEAPYKTVLTHGFTVDADGRKMSKSLGNVLSAEKAVKTYGADILRLWVSSIDYRNEIIVSDEILKRVADSYRRIRNTARFLLANTFDFNPSDNLVPAGNMLALDRYIVDKVRLLQIEIRDAYDKYLFHEVYQKIHHLCAIDLGSFYLDIVKDRQYTMQKNSIARRSAQTAMYYILEAMVCWIAPILSFTAEEIWQHLPGKRPASVFLAAWYEELPELGPNEALNQAYWEKIIAVRNVVNKELEQARVAGVIGAGLESEVTLYADQNIQQLLSPLQDELRFVMITSAATVLPIAEKTALAAESDVQGLWIAVSASAHKKCERCWHRRVEVGVESSHPTLCGRCVTNVDGVGEERRFA